MEIRCKIFSIFYIVVKFMGLGLKRHFMYRVGVRQVVDEGSVEFINHIVTLPA